MSILGWIQMAVPKAPKLVYQYQSDVYIYLVGMNAVLRNMHPKVTCDLWMQLNHTA